MRGLAARVARMWRQYADEGKKLAALVDEMRAENARLRSAVALLAADVAVVKAERVALQQARANLTAKES